MLLSLVCSFAVIPSCKTYKVSCSSAAILRPRPFNALAVGLSTSFDLTSAPSNNTMVFIICVCSICFATFELTMRLVKRVQT